MLKNWLGCLICSALGLVVLAGITPNAAIGRGFGGGGGYNGGGGNNNNRYNNWRASTQKNANNSQNQNGEVTPTTTPAEIADAQNQLQLANQQLLQVSGKLKSAFEQSSPWTAAKASLDQAQSEYSAAAAVVLTNLKSNPDYAAALQALHDANAQLDAVHHADDPSPEAIATAAQAVMDAKLKVTALENAALQPDPAAAAAKAKITAAGTVIDQVKTQFQSTCKLNPDWVAAKQAVADAQARLDTLMGNPPPAVAQQ